MNVHHLPERLNAQAAAVALFESLNSGLLEDAIIDGHVDWALVEQRQPMLSSSEQVVVELAAMCANGRFDRFDSFLASKVRRILDLHLRRD